MLIVLYCRFILMIVVIIGESLSKSHHMRIAAMDLCCLIANTFIFLVRDKGNQHVD